MLLAACSGGGETPEALAFEDSSSSDPVVDGTGDGAGDDAGTDDGAGDDGAGDDGAGDDGAGAATTNRPTTNLCESSEFSIAFPESFVLTDPATTMIPDVAFDVPAGTYDIFMVTWKGFTEDPSQTMEQWFFETNGATPYVSELSSDDDAELIVINQPGTAVTVDAFTSIKLSHKAPGMDSANSVHPICVGFRAVDAPVETTTTTEAPVVVEETTTTTEAPVVVEETTTTEAPVDETPVVETPAETTEAPVAEAPVVVEEPTTATEAPVVVEETTTTTEPPAVGGAQIVTTTTTAPATTTARPAVGPELALTGPSELATSLGLTGAALLLAGSAAVVAARRSEDD